MASVIVQLEDTTTREQAMMGRRSSTAHVLDELVLPNSNTQEACEAFARCIAPLVSRQNQVPLRIYGDAAGGARSTAGK